MQDHCSSPSRLVHRFITPRHVSDVVDQRRVRTLTRCVALLPISTTAGLGRRRGWDRRRLRCDQANGENAARPTRAPLRNGAAVHGSTLKIATDIASIVRSSEVPARTDRSLSLREWRLMIVGERDGNNGENASR